jgi:cytochrome c nitrite reductase small subunit
MATAGPDVRQQRRGLRGRLAAASAAAIGLAAGLGAFTFVYARGASYLTNDPAACANCHIMTEHHDAWLKSSHRSVAVCNDCHAPHTFIGKYATKARNGFWHSFYFTTGRYPDPLRITEGNRRITENACRDCHADVTEALLATSHAEAPVARGEGADPGWSCVRCHRYVGHYVR